MFFAINFEPHRLMCTLTPQFCHCELIYGFLTVAGWSPAALTQLPYQGFYSLWYWVLVLSGRIFYWWYYGRLRDDNQCLMEDVECFVWVHYVYNGILCTWSSIMELHCSLLLHSTISIQANICHAISYSAVRGKWTRSWFWEMGQLEIKLTDI